MPFPYILPYFFNFDNLSRVEILYQIERAVPPDIYL
jgi:hypothetical protein